MAILSMCTGVGALDSAVEAVTSEVTTHVAESDPAAAAVLAHRFPEVVNLGDITRVDWAAFAAKHPEIDVIAAGFPCQNISNAGRREGITGEKSRVWNCVAMAIGHVRPRVAFLENVGALRTRGLDIVAADLARIGYDLRWATVRADEVGAAHVRRRWFGVAAPEDADGEPWDQRLIAAPRQEAGGGHGPTLDDEVSHLLPDPASIRRPERRAESAELERAIRRPAGNGGEPTPDPDHGGRDGRSGDESEPQGRDEPADSHHSPAEWWGEYLPAIRRWELITQAPAPCPTEIGPRGGRRLAPAFAEWLMGWPAGWVTDVPGVGRSDQLRCIGNGVVPQQAMEAYSRLLEGQ